MFSAFPDVCVLLLSSVYGLLVVMCLLHHKTFIHNKIIKRLRLETERGSCLSLLARWWVGLLPWLSGGSVEMVLEDLQMGPGGASPRWEKPLPSESER